MRPCPTHRNRNRRGAPIRCPNQPAPNAPDETDKRRNEATRPPRPPGTTMAQTTSDKGDTNHSPADSPRFAPRRARKTKPNEPILNPAAGPHTLTRIRPPSAGGSTASNAGRPPDRRHPQPLPGSPPHAADRTAASLSPTHPASAPPNVAACRRPDRALQYRLVARGGPHAASLRGAVRPTAPPLEPDQRNPVRNLDRRELRRESDDRSACAAAPIDRAYPVRIPRKRPGTEG